MKMTVCTQSLPCTAVYVLQQVGVSAQEACAVVATVVKQQLKNHSGQQSAVTVRAVLSKKGAARVHGDLEVSSL
ncbi:hypothetical protein E2C01_022566 [Portunus trituberculatus]|uniref:Uncharacterized protein n=1 Tax=Portunus trituberculatus TaxID=210409 RepID=A0A5B7E6B7_PORTR|nr:hypothetical protein [Portunus trituberculatus]